MKKPDNPVALLFFTSGLVGLLTALFLYSTPLEAQLANIPEAQAKSNLYPLYVLLAAGVVFLLSLAAHFQPQRFEPLLRLAKQTRTRMALDSAGLVGLVLLWGSLLIWGQQGVHTFFVSRGKYLAACLTLLFVAWIGFSRSLGSPAKPGKVKSRWAVLLSAIFPLLTLGIQNLAIFWQHYFANVGFPWDFPLAYYGFVVYWTSAASKGIYPEWMPFQQMGYPLALNLQSGRNYPPFWIFPALNIPYTLNAAVVFQCLHVLGGAIGAYLFFKQILKRRSFALVGAVAFQFFGGFYSNAQHPDIVRAFAMLPWMFWAFTLEDGRIAKRNLLIPIAIWFMATGGYPGNFVASLFILALYVLLQTGSQALEQRTVWTLAQAFAWVGGLTIFGLALSLPHLAPAWIERGQMLRYQEYNNLAWNGMRLRDLYALFLPIQDLELMRSIYLTYPILALIFLVPWKKARTGWIFCCVGIMAALMSGGGQSSVWLFVTGFLSPLKISRFPTSDYRTIAVLMGILLGLWGLAVLVKGEISPISQGLRFVLLILFCGLAVKYAYAAIPAIPVIQELSLVAGSLLMLASLPVLRTSAWSYRLSILLLILVMSWDASRVLSAMPNPWQAPDFDRYYQDLGWRFMEDGHLVTPEIFTQEPAQRPARIIPARGLDYAWRGYITGDYMIGDLQRSYLAAATEIHASQAYSMYMKQAWTPVVLALPEDFDPGSWTVEEGTFAGAAAPGYLETRIRQVRYGLDELSYEVNLSQPAILIENEMYFPGWKARFMHDDREETINAFAVNGIFRSWVLPAGSYQMTAQFAFPNMRVYKAIQWISLIVVGAGSVAMLMKWKWLPPAWFHLQPPAE